VTVASRIGNARAVTVIAALAATAAVLWTLSVWWTWANTLAAVVTATVAALSVRLMIVASLDRMVAKFEADLAALRPPGRPDLRLLTPPQHDE